MNMRLILQKDYFHISVRGTPAALPDFFFNISGSARQPVSISTGKMTAARIPTERLP